MNLFLSRYNNYIDKKGRISIPSSYRNILTQNDFNGLIIYPSLKHQCLEVSSFQRLEELSRLIQALEPYSEERDALEAVIMGESIQLSFDGEGRIVIPKQLLESAKITSQACIVGKGLVFEVWQPEEFDCYLTKAKIIAHKSRLLLKNV